MKSKFIRWVAKTQPFLMLEVVPCCLKPCLLTLALGGPKRQRWCELPKPNIHVSLACCVLRATG